MSTDYYRLLQALSPALKRLSLALIISILAMAGFVIIAHKMVEGDTIAFDDIVLHCLNRSNTPFWHQVMLVISILAGPIFQSLFWGIAVTWFAYKRMFWPDGFSLLIAGGGGLVLVVGLKFAFHRPRPQVIFDHLGYSFPSGHSFFALVIYGMTAYLMSRDMQERHRKLLWLVAATMIFLVGFSRIYLGEHYPSDVIAGFAIGLPWLWACLAIPQTFHRDGKDLSVDEAIEDPLSIL